MYRRRTPEIQVHSIQIARPEKWGVERTLRFILGGHLTRHNDFNSPYRSTFGFDRLFQLLDGLGSANSDSPTHPLYNFERRGDNEYRISMTFASFSQDEWKVYVEELTLTVNVKKQAGEGKSSYLHRGIAQRRFELADHVTVVGADLKAGLLHVDLIRNIPESMKPKSIPIGRKSTSKLLESALAPSLRISTPVLTPVGQNTPSRYLCLRTAD